MKEEQQLEVLYGMVQKSLESLEEVSAQIAEQTAANTKSVETVQSMAPVLQNLTSHETATTMRSGFEILSKGVVKTVTAAGQESAAKIQASSDEAKVVIKELKTAQAGIRRDWWFIALLTTLFGATGVLVAGILMTWWMRADIDSMREERRSIAVDIAALKETAAQWEAKLGRAEVTTCRTVEGRQRLCVRIDEEAGSFGGKDEKTYRVIWGY